MLNMGKGSMQEAKRGDRLNSRSPLFLFYFNPNSACLTGL